MARISLEIRVIAFAFLWLCVAESGLASRKEDLERAAELAVERAAERAAERAVEKALESGNSTTETETIRESYSSVRTKDKTIQLPASGYTPFQRHEYDRILREQEAAEKASAVLKRSVDNGKADARQAVVDNSDQRSYQQQQPKQQLQLQQQQQQQQQLEQLYKKLPELVPPTPGSTFVTKQLPFPLGGRESSYAIAARDQQRQQHQQTLPSVETYAVRNQFPSSYPVKVYAIKTTKPYPVQLFHVVPVPSPVVVESSTSAVTYPRSIDRQAVRVANTGDYTITNENERRPGQGWIYR